MRERVYKIARVLPIIFVADGLFMAWARAKADLSGIGYTTFIFIPVFIPAFLVGLVLSAIYVHGFARRSWTVRKAESLFFLLFFLAIAAKVAVFMAGRRARQLDDLRYGVHAVNTVGEQGASR